MKRSKFKFLFVFCVILDVHIVVHIKWCETAQLYEMPQPYLPAAQDWLPTEAKQGWAWSVPGWEISWEN